MKNTTTKQYSVGIDVGSVSLNCMVIDQNKEIVFESPYGRHFGKMNEAILELVEQLVATLGQNHIQSISFTGNHGKKLAEKLGAFYEFETISQALGVMHIMPQARSLICMGGQDT
ncbi:MAG: hypothetical protein PVG35_20930, partial [Desulfobacterales bacterium]